MQSALEDRQAEKMRSDAAYQHIVTIKKQMLGRNGGGYSVSSRSDEIDGVLGCNMLKNDAQIGEFLDQRCQCSLDKNSLAIENVDIVVRDFSVYQQREVASFHGRQGWLQRF